MSRRLVTVLFGTRVSGGLPAAWPPPPPSNYGRPGRLWLLQWLSALACLSAVVGSVHALPHSDPSPCPSCLVAGAASVDVTPPVGVPLAGYGGPARRLLLPDLLDRHPLAFWFKPSEGVHDPIMARALLLQFGAVRLLWISVDLIAVDSDMVQDLKTRLAASGFTYASIIVSASHTHSGPGTFARSWLFEALALDRHVPAVREQLLKGIADAARLAEARKRPARVGVGRGEVRGIIKSRVNLPTDPEVGVLKVVGETGTPVALVWNYAIHGTVLGPRNRLLSGDVMSAVSETLERALRAPALYTNGAVGDVSPSRKGWEGVRDTSEALARGVRAVWSRTPLERSARLSVVTEQIALPPPRLSVRNCVGRLVPVRVRLGLSWAMPRTTEMVGVAIGDSAWVTVPGELQTRLGQAVKARGRQIFPLAFVAGLSNDYLGYFLTPEEFAKGGYIGCVALYGEEGGQLLADRAEEIFRKLRAASARR